MISLILCIVETAVIIFLLVSRKSKTEIINKFLEDQTSFKDFDNTRTELGLLVEKRIKEHPEEWSADKYTFMNRKIGIDLWISNGLGHVRIYRFKGEDVQDKLTFTEADRVAIWFQIEDFLRQEKYIHREIYNDVKSRLES